MVDDDVQEVELRWFRQQLQDFGIFKWDVIKYISVGLTLKCVVTCQPVRFLSKWDMVTCISGTSV
jgi:hypothetical protein